MRNACDQASIYDCRLRKYGATMVGPGIISHSDIGSWSTSLSKRMHGSTGLSFVSSYEENDYEEWLETIVKANGATVDIPFLPKWSDIVGVSWPFDKFYFVNNWFHSHARQISGIGVDLESVGNICQIGKMMNSSLWSLQLVLNIMCWYRPAAGKNSSVVTCWGSHSVRLHRLFRCCTHTWRQWVINGAHCNHIICLDRDCSLPSGCSWWSSWWCLFKLDNAKNGYFVSLFLGHEVIFVRKTLPVFLKPVWDSIFDSVNWLSVFSPSF